MSKEFGNMSQNLPKQLRKLKIEILALFIYFKNVNTDTYKRSSKSSILALGSFVASKQEIVFM